MTTSRRRLNAFSPLTMASSDDDKQPAVADLDADTQKLRRDDRQSQGDSDSGDVNNDGRGGDRTRLLPGEQTHRRVEHRDDIKSDPLPPFARQALFFFTYAGYYAVSTVSGPLLPSIAAEMSLTAGQTVSVAATQTMGQAAGKVLFGGWPVDLCGARRTLFWTMLGLGVLAVALSRADSERSLSAVAFLTEFLATSVYPAHVVFVRGWWPASRQADGFRLLGLTSRAGDLLCKVVWGQLLVFLAWRQVSLAAATLALLTAFVAFRYHRDASQGPADQPGAALSLRELWLVLHRMFSSGYFLLAIVSTSSLYVLKQTCERLLPVYLHDSDPEHVSLSAAAQLSAVWSAGLATSILVGGHYFGRLKSATAKANLAAATTAVSALAFFLLALCETLPKTQATLVLKLAVIFTAAAGVGLSYYIPSGVFAVRFGGTNAGVVSAYLDAATAVVAALFLAVLRPVVDGSGGWQGGWLLMGASGCLASALIWVFVRRVFHDEPS
eukprot:m.30781 g.30781  ORF g.30781 m.30781 type:complete len:497 (-) comp9548_c0_seq1:317-1807(-)